MKQKYFHFTIVAPQHNGYRTKQANILSNEYATTDTKSQWWRGGNLEDKVRAWAGQCDTLYIVKAATIDKDEYICNQADLEEMAQKESTHKHLHFNGIVPKFFYMALLAYDKRNNTYHALGI